jgi:purine-binding chemotaxis protein CheW
MTQAPYYQKTGSHTLSGKYFTFKLNHEACGIQVLKIREIIRAPKITTAPPMPAYLCRVVNLRSRLIRVMNLGLRLGLAEAQPTGQSCIVVDAVEAAVNLATADIGKSPDVGARLNTDLILGLAKIKGEVKTLIDADRVDAAVTAYEQKVR